ncbi:MAG: NAD(P)H-dependent oxidoreductase [Oscillospiraceae bacterium]|nr:NAD(P)H-dependent oxidoreductase [Oscillospiraceae bacterium]
MELLVIAPRPDAAEDGARLAAVLDAALHGIPYRMLTDMTALPALRGRRLLFALALGRWGVNTAYTQLLLRLRREPTLLERCTAALVVDGAGEFYTKSTAAELALAANLAGCAFIGRPLVEGTGSLCNFRVQAKLLHTDLDGAYRDNVRELAERLLAPPLPMPQQAKLLALHASSYHTSNTMQLWAQVKRRLGGGCDVTEIGLRNGAVSDCAGCPYTACLHFGEKDRCFYGGLMQDEVWPAVRRCDAVVLLCPNYNDALSANLTAFINRLTGLFRQTRFYDKAVFAIVVSGYSGGDTVARQVISAMNMNKSFRLPARFALIETANDPGEALTLPGMEQRLDAFARRIRDTLLAPDAGGAPRSRE